MLGSGLKTALWRNETAKNGRTVVQYSIKLTKSYKDPKTDEWKSMAINLFPSEVPAAQLVLGKALEYSVLKESEDDSDLPPVAR